MKLAVLALFIVFAVFVSGCTTPSPAAPAVAVQAPAPPAAASAAVIPDITGTWTGTMAGYAPARGFTNYGNATMSMIITEQKGRIVAGTFVFGTGTNQTKADCSGIIARDGRTLIMTETNGGYSFGEILGSGEIELTYVYDGSPNTASIDTLRKV
nr:hypothetical protein [uncultured Methanoregula sp.]